MKSKILILLVLLSSIGVNAQWTSAGGSDIMTDASTDKVGIGMYPSQKLSINGNVHAIGDIFAEGDLYTQEDLEFPRSTDGPRYIKGTSPNYSLNLWSDDDNTGGSGIRLFSAGSSISPGGIQLISNYSNSGLTNTGWDFLGYNSTTSGWFSALKIKNNGDLDVKRNIFAEGDLYTAEDLEFPRSTDGPRYIKGTSPNYSLNLWSDDDNTGGSGIRLFSAGSSISPGGIQLISNYSNSGLTNTGWDFLGYNSTTSGWFSAVKIKNNGDLDVKRNVFAEGDLYTAEDLEFPRAIDGPRYIKGTSPDYSLNLWSNNDNTDGSGIRLFSEGATISGGMQLISRYNSNVPGDVDRVGWDLLGYDADGSGTWASKMKIRNDGQVVIGDVNTVPYTNNNPTYKLYVQTGILTEKVKVALSNDPYGNWSDFVFDDDYELRSLNEVETYIKENKHLPEIPSAEEVCKEGLDLARMDAKLLQKIEELTLYVIQQQKEIDELKSKLNK